MLREYEPERRRRRDDANLAHAKWDLYRLEKRRLEDMGLEPDEYGAKVMILAQELGV